MKTSNRILSILPFLALFTALALVACGNTGTGNEQDTGQAEKKAISDADMAKAKKVYVAGGCFWGLQELFRKQKGVISTEVGYSGGENEFPTYRNHPGHAETVAITYDSTQTSFMEILDYFYRIHDPTTLNQQGNDRGTSYRSAIFYQNAEEKQIAREVIALVDKSDRWGGKVVTKLEPYVKFWPAEEEHQDYLRKNPNGYTCHYERFGTFLDKP